MEQHTLILPGLNGSGREHWQHVWLEDHPDALLVEQEDWQHPRLDAWLYRLEAEIAAHPGAILVGHSLGALLVANLADRPAADHVAGALLVAPCDLDAVEELHPGLADFGRMPRKRLPFPSIVVASRNDVYFDYDCARRFGGIWGSGHVDLGEAGHINVASGFGRWADGYALVSAFRH